MKTTKEVLDEITNEAKEMSCKINSIIDDFNKKHEVDCLLRINKEQKLVINLSIEYNKLVEKAKSGC